MATKAPNDRVTVRLKDEDRKIVDVLQDHFGADVTHVVRIAIRALLAKEKLKLAGNPVRS